MTKSFSEKKIAVVGDLMLDKYIQGTVERISPEAPIPIVQVTKERYVPGGAANTANNIASLGGKAALYGVIGLDQPGELLCEETKKRSITITGLIKDPQKPTTQKIRVIGLQQQLLRIDYELTSTLTGSLLKDWDANLQTLLNMDGIVISDYDKGVVTESTVDQIKSLAKKNSIPVIVDPKPAHKNWYHGVFLLTPNRKEAEEMSGLKLTSTEKVEEAGIKLSNELDAHILITMGERGMSLFEKGKSPFHIPTVAREVFDVSGAGDTVVATLALAITSDYSLREACILANEAAGVKVGKLGTAPVTWQELKGLRS